MTGFRKSRIQKQIFEEYTPGRTASGTNELNWFSKLSHLSD